MSGRWRCFVAVPVADRLRGDLARAVATWRDDPDLAGLRWTDPEAWHVTLVFLGWIDPAALGSIVSAMQATAEAAFPGSLTTGGVGAFPSAARTRVLWYGIADPHEFIAGLSHELWRALRLQGPQAFRPHVTLARARHGPVGLRDAIGRLAAPTGTLAVEEIRLMRSHLGGGPARYETLASVQIGARIHG